MLYKPKLPKKRGVKLVIGLLFIAFLVLFGLGISSSSAVTDPVVNPELINAAKSAKRAADFLDWSLDLTQIENSGSGTSSTLASVSNTLIDLWYSTFKLVIFVYLGIAIVIAFGFILKANWLDRWRRYIPWLVISFVVAAFSFLIARFIVNIVDSAIFGLGQVTITNILNIADYDSLNNLVASGDITNLETVNNTITLLKILSFTAYGIGIVFVFGTIVIWMLIIFLPLIFPFIAFPVTQSIARVWLREFIRWLLYGVLVAMFLYASSSIYSSIASGQTGGTDYNNTDSTNISLTLPSSGGAGASVGTTTTGTVSDANTYSQYIASIIMLWASIILPWLLLRFVFNVASDATEDWYERNKTNPRLQKILQSLRPPTSQNITTQQKTTSNRTNIAPLRTTTSVEQSNLVAPASQQAQQKLSQENIADNIAIQSPTNAENIGSFRDMNPANALQASGLANLSMATSTIEKGRSEQAPLSQLASVELNPARSADVDSDVNILLNPELAQSENERQRVVDLRSGVFAGGVDKKDRGIASLIRNDTTSIVNRSIARELNEKNIETVREKVARLIESGKVTNQTTQNQLQELSTTINRYQTTPDSKPGEKHVIGDQIERAVKNITGSKDNHNQQGQRPANNLPAGAAKVKNAEELATSDEGKELMDSMEVLNASEVAENAGAGGVDALLTGGDDIKQAVADKKTNDDFQKTKQQWVNFYKDTPVPTTEKIKNRQDWLKEQISQQEKMLHDITTGDFDERKKALHRMQKIIPYLFLGNYSLLEITLYLKAKIAAAKKVYDDIDNNPKPQEYTQEEPPKPYEPQDIKDSAPNNSYE